eukprot:403361563
MIYTGNVGNELSTSKLASKKIIQNDNNNLDCKSLDSSYVEIPQLYKQSHLHSILSGQAFTNVKKKKIIDKETKDIDVNELMNNNKRISSSSMIQQSKRNSALIVGNQKQGKSFESVKISDQFLLPDISQKSFMKIEQYLEDQREPKTQQHRDRKLKDDSIGFIDYSSKSDIKVIVDSQLLDKVKLLLPDEVMTKQYLDVSKQNSIINTKRKSKVINSNRELKKRLKTLSSRNQSPNSDLKQLFDNYFGPQTKRQLLIQKKSKKKLSQPMQDDSSQVNNQSILYNESDHQNSIIQQKQLKIQQRSTSQSQSPRKKKALGQLEFQLVGGADEIRSNYLKKVLEKITILHLKKEKRRRKLLKKMKKELKESETHQALLRELQKTEYEIQTKINDKMKKLNKLNQESLQNKSTQDIVCKLPINKKETSTTENSHLTNAYIDTGITSPSLQQSSRNNENRRKSQQQILLRKNQNISVSQFSGKIKSYLHQDQSNYNCEYDITKPPSSTKYFKTLNEDQNKKESRTLSRIKMPSSRLNQSELRLSEVSGINNDQFSKQSSRYINPVKNTTSQILKQNQSIIINKRKDYQEIQNQKESDISKISNFTTLNNYSQTQIANNNPTQLQAEQSGGDQTPQLFPDQTPTLSQFSSLNINSSNTRIRSKLISNLQNNNQSGASSLLIHQNRINNKNNSSISQSNINNEDLKIQQSKKNKQKFQELMNANWDDKIMLLRKQVNDIRDKSYTSKLNSLSQNSHYKPSSSSKDKSQKKVVQFTLPEI